MKKRLPGINIQFPISQLILNGSKTIETRTYPIPRAYIGQELAIIETPGSAGDFPARIVGLIVFGDSFQYPNEIEFNNDFKKHFVDKTSIWKWQKDSPKWGWPILSVKPLKRLQPAPRQKGIRYTKDVQVEL